VEIRKYRIRKEDGSWRLKVFVGTGPLGPVYVVISSALPTQQSAVRIMNYRERLHEQEAEFTHGFDPARQTLGDPTFWRTLAPQIPTG
jgi:hypothetical protein